MKSFEWSLAFKKLGISEKTTVENSRVFSANSALFWEILNSVFHTVTLSFSPNSVPKDFLKKLGGPIHLGV